MILIILHSDFTHNSKKINQLFLKQLVQVTPFNFMKNQYFTLLFIIHALLMFNCSGIKSSSAPSIESKGSGIYMTAADYASGKLSLEVDCKSEKHKIKTHDFTGKPHIVVIHQGNEFRYKKSSVYGYRDCDGNVFRFVGNNEYKILESKSLTLYQIDVLKPNPSGKGSVTVKESYFSLKQDSEIKSLTIFNLKNAFPDDHNFHDQLDAAFKYDEDLMEYDSFHKSYKVNHILETTLQK